MQDIHKWLKEHKNDEVRTPCKYESDRADVFHSQNLCNKR